MCITEYDEKKVMAQFRADGYEDGMLAGERKGRREGERKGRREGRREGCNNLVDAVRRLRAGETVEELITSGVDRETAMSAKSIS